jgi:hypothetical protein
MERYVDAQSDPLQNNDNTYHITHIQDVRYKVTKLAYLARLWRRDPLQR